MLVWPVWAGAACAPDRVDLQGPWGEMRFQVELVDTPETRARGLMFRENLSPRAGMLFIYEHPQRAAFWMKNTLIPLDMLFFDQTGRLRHLHSNAIPGDLTPIEGGQGILGVLEINGGMAKRLGITPETTPDTVLRHPAFGPQAAWPCD